MKNVIKLLSILLLTFGVIFISCKPEEEDPGTGTGTGTVSAPTKLAVSDITMTTAKLSWTGSADSYEITVGTEVYTSTSTSYNLTNLNDNTNYTWKVRAKKGSDYSAWVNGPNFKTDSRIKVQWGTEIWTPDAMYGTFASVWFVAWLFKDAVPELPMIQIFPDAAVDNYVLDMDEEFGFYWLAESILYSLVDEDGNETGEIGDWMLKSGTINITRCNDSGISFVYDAVMVDSWDFVMAENPSAETRNLKVTVENVPFSTWKTNNIRKTNSFKLGSSKLVKK